MKFAEEIGEILVFDELPSSQTKAIELIRHGDLIGGVLAIHQTDGRGRFDRKWLSNRGESLAVSLVFEANKETTDPWLPGMMLAVAAARALNLQLQWPNDLVLNGRKVGGILSEIVIGADHLSRVVCGLGVNLAQREMPDSIAHSGTSIFLERSVEWNAKEALNAILAELRKLPKPETWHDLESAWNQYDATKGKVYKCLDGSSVTAVKVGNQGQLIAKRGSNLVEIVAADAIFGPGGTEVQ